jgi:hypothetical protein
MKRAIKQIRRMRGGAQSHLMRCDVENYYVVKFQNNPQGANELLGTRLAARLGLAIPAAEAMTMGGCSSAAAGTSWEAPRAGL